MVQHFEKDAHDVPVSDSHKSNDSNVISFHSHDSCMPFIIHLNSPPSFSMF